MKKPDYYFYPAVFGYEPGEKISVFFPDLDVATSGEDDIDAFQSARELLGITMWGIEDDGEDVPAASGLSDIQCSEVERVVLVDVYMPSIRLSNVSQQPRSKLTGHQTCYAASCGVLTLATFVKWMCKHIRLTHCSRE